MSYRMDGLKDFRIASGVSATGAIGSGANGVVTTTVTLKGVPGNSYSIRTVLGAGSDTAMSAAISGTAITVTLGTDVAEAPDATKNTATLIAAAVDALDGVTAAASGSGVTAISTAIGPITFSGGRFADTVWDVAKRAGFNTKYYRQIEAGRPCDPEEAARLAAALGTTIGGLTGVAL